MTKILIDPVSRIEGHAKITILLGDDGHVSSAQFHVTEFRGFEQFCEGRPLWEMPGITARICGICPVSHLLASAKAGDAILSVRIPEAAAKLRRMMNLGQIIQSHALSFFHLSMPDLLLGMDSDPAQRNIFGLIGADREFARSGIRLRQFGQEVIEHLGGRKIHPAWAVPGGVRSPLSHAAAAQIRAKLPEALTTTRQALARFKQLIAQFPDEIASFGTAPTLFMGLIGPDGTWEHYDGKLRFMDASGVIVADQLDPASYRSVIGEAAEPWSYLKFPYYTKLGYPNGAYRVGPLARVNICRTMGTPEADLELIEFRQRVGAPAQSGFFYHYARLIEILSALERIGQLILDADVFSDRLRADAGINQTLGVGVSEAPRGTLFHEYQVDDYGVVRRVNLIIATGQNNLAMNQTVTQVAKQFIHGPNIPEGMLNRVEASIRAFDPCLSCSTHAVGQMPLQIELRAANGELLDQRQRG